MSLVVNHNLMSANTARNLNAHYGHLATSTQRLSSGLRINGASDDAAGLAIRELMRADVAALHQGVRNANDAISMIQVVDGALGVIDEKLIRMKELAEQAATGTYDSTQRLMIDSEFQAMASEIQRIAVATDFNGIKLIDGSDKKKIPNNIILNTPTIKQSTSVENLVEKQCKNFLYTESSIEITTNSEYTTEYIIDNDIIYENTTINDSIIKNTSTEEFKISYYVFNQGSLNIWYNTWCKFNVEPTDKESIGLLRNVWFGGGYNADKIIDQNYEYVDNPSEYENRFAGYNHFYRYICDLNSDGKADITYVFALDKYLDINIPKRMIRIEGLRYNYRGIQKSTESSTQVITEKTIIDANVPAKDVKIHFGPMNDSAEDYYSIEKRDCTLKGLGLEDVRIETQDNAQKALVTINDAIVKKDQARAYYGAMQNRLENTVSNLTIQAENLQASESRISDVDVATEMTNFVRNQILTQSAVAMLSQANSMPQMAMQLIGG